MPNALTTYTVPESSAPRDYTDPSQNRLYDQSLGNVARSLQQVADVSTRAATVFSGMERQRAASDATKYELDLLAANEELKGTHSLEDRRAEWDIRAQSLRDRYAENVGTFGQNTWDARSEIALKRAGYRVDREIQHEVVRSGLAFTEAQGLHSLELATNDPSQRLTIEQGYKGALENAVAQKWMTGDEAALRMEVWRSRANAKTRSREVKGTAQNVADGLLGLYDQAQLDEDTANDVPLSELVDMVSSFTDDPDVREAAEQIVRRKVADREADAKLHQNNLAEEAFRVINEGGTPVDLPDGLDESLVSAMTEKYRREITEQTDRSKYRVTDDAYYNEIIRLFDTPEGIETFRKKDFYLEVGKLSTSDFNELLPIWKDLQPATAKTPKAIRLIGSQAGYFNDMLDDYPELSDDQVNRARRAFVDLVSERAMAKGETISDIEARQMALDAIKPVSQEKWFGLTRTDAVPGVLMDLSKPSDFDDYVANPDPEVLTSARELAIKTWGPDPSDNEITAAMKMVLKKRGAAVPR